ncbi:MAG: WD40 repeat domain-containing protein [Planctomycetota bacterium]
MPLSQIKVLKELNRKEIFLSIARDAKSGRLFCGASDFKIYGVQDPLAEKPEFSAWTGHSSYVTGLACAAGHLISGSYDGQLIWWDLNAAPAADATNATAPANAAAPANATAAGEAAGPRVRTIAAHQKWIRKVVASPDGQWIASVADDMVCRVWESATGQLRWELKGHAERTPQHFPSMLYACAFHPSGEQLATVDKVGHVVVWNLANGQPLMTMETPTMYTWDPKQRVHSIGGPRSLAFSPDGKLLAVGGMDQVGNIDHLEGKSRVEVFEWSKAERVQEFTGDGFKGLVERLIFLPDGECLLGLGGDNGGFVQAFDLKEKRILKQEKAATHVHDAVLGETSERLYGAAHQRLIVWELSG